MPDLGCPVLLVPASQLQWRTFAILEQKIGDEQGVCPALDGQTVFVLEIIHLFGKGCYDIAGVLWKACSNRLSDGCNELLH